VAPFDDFRRAVDARHGVGDVTLARTHGVSANSFYRRTAREGWLTPLPGVRVVPDAKRSVQRDLVTVCAGTRHLAAASGLTAAWLHGLRQRPPSRSQFVVAHGTDLPCLRGTTGRLARWLRASDITDLEGVPTLTGTAMLLSVANLAARPLRALGIAAPPAGAPAAAAPGARGAAARPPPGRAAAAAPPPPARPGPPPPRPDAN
jgi:hypothetical protein